MKLLIIFPEKNVDTTFTVDFEGEGQLAKNLNFFKYLPPGGEKKRQNSAKKIY